MKKVLAVLFVLFPSLAFAFDGKTVGKIDLVEVGSNFPYSFMVRLVGEPPLCGSSSKGWAYLSHDDPNYSTYVTMILAAKLNGKEVTIYANRKPQDYCEVVHFHFK